MSKAKYKLSLLNTPAMSYNSAGRRDLRNQNYSGQDLRRKDFFRGADLRGANFSGADLRSVDFSDAEIQGVNFRHANLCEANFTHASASVDPLLSEVDFSGAKISGTNFSDAYLNHAIFTEVQTGLTRSWSFILYSIHLFLCLLSAFTATISCTFLVYFSRTSNKKLSLLNSIFIGIISTLIIVILRTILLNFFSQLLFPSVILGIAAIVIVFLIAFVTAVTNEEENFNSFIITGVLLFIILIITTRAILFAGFEDSLPKKLGYLVHNLGSKTIENPNGTNGKWLSTVSASVIGSLFGCWFARSAITEGTQFNWLWKLYIKAVTYGGTLFSEADLTDATFTSATLRGANFKNSTIIRTRWRGVKSLERTRVGNSYLRYSKIRQLVLGQNVRHKEFDGLNLKGINLEELNLSNASFIGANLSQANLRGSNLKNANLQQVNLDGADLSNTCLTGACLQDWTRDEKTIFAEIECDYIYLEELPDQMAGRRRFPPSPKNFKSGDFEKFYRKDNSIVQLLLRNEDNRQALAATFQELMKGNFYQLQGFEMVGSDALVNIQIPKNADASAVENKFYQTYKTELDQVNQAQSEDPNFHEGDKQPSLREVIIKLLKRVDDMSGDRIIVSF